MAILGQEKTSKYGLKGQTQTPTETLQSRLHNLASINNNPLLSSLPLKFQRFLQPSRLDPTSIKRYTDNLPK